MKIIFLVSVLIFGVFAGIKRNEERNEILEENDERRQEMIETNRVPKIPHENQENLELSFDLRCDECEMFVRELDSLLRNPQYVNALKTFLKRYGCDAMPKTLKEYCDSVIDDLEIALDYLEPMLQNPKQVCTDVGMCEGNGLRMVKFSVKMLKAFLEKMRLPTRFNDLPCDECKFAVGELHSVIKSKEFQDEFRQTVEKLCDYCPAKQKCKSFIDDFLPTFFQEMESLTGDAQGFCSELGLCHGGTRVFSMKLQKAYDHVTKVITLDGSMPNTRVKQFYTTLTRLHGRKGNNLGCVACEFAVKSLKSMIIQNKPLLDNVVQEVESIICNRLPYDLNEQCIDFLNLYGSSALIMVVQEEIDPDQICSGIHVCDSTDLMLLEQNEETRGALECEACTGIVEYIKYEMESKEFQDSVVDALKQVCESIFHGESKEEQCESMVQEYWPAVAEELKNYLKPKQLCVDIGMCGSANIGNNISNDNIGENIGGGGGASA